MNCVSFLDVLLAGHLFDYLRSVKSMAEYPMLPDVVRLVREHERSKSAKRDVYCRSPLWHVRSVWMQSQDGGQNSRN